LLVLLKPSKQRLLELIGNKEKVYQYVKEEFYNQYNIEWLQPIGFNNAYALMMRRLQARELNIQTISDLKNYLDK
jgi:osmoprotectant transport system permease protein